MLRFPCTYRDRDYWLCRCQGFDAYRGGRRPGKVAEVRFRSRHDRPDALVVRGRLSRAPRVVRVEEVESIEPDRQRVVLRDTPGIPVPDGSVSRSAVRRAPGTPRIQRDPYGNPRAGVPE